MEVSGQLHVPAALPPGKEPLVSLDRRLGGPHIYKERDYVENENGYPGILYLEI
jgi:hypothetical protein